MRKLHIYVLLIVFCFSEAICLASNKHPVQEVVANGGDYYESDWILLSWTLGEVASELIGYENQLLSQGFQQPHFSYKLGSKAYTCLTDTFYAPIVATDTVVNCIGFDIDVKYDRAKLVPTGKIILSDALIDTSIVGQLVTVSHSQGIVNVVLYLEGMSSITYFRGVGELLRVEFVKTFAMDYVDTVTFEATRLIESYFTGNQRKLVEPVNQTSFKDSILVGQLEYWNNKVPLIYDPVNPDKYAITNIFGTDSLCENISTNGVQPTTNGDFHYSIWNGTSINIQRDIHDTTRVMSHVNGFDGLQIKRLLKDDISFIPSIFQILAMDVNLDGHITAGDLTQVNFRTVHLIKEFIQKWNYDELGNSNGEKSKDWLFVDSAYISVNPAFKISTLFPNDDGIGYSKNRVPNVSDCIGLPIKDYNGCPLVASRLYQGIFLGDADGSFDTLTGIYLKSAAIDEAVIFDLSQINSGKIGSNQVPVYAQADYPVYAVDFVIHFDDKVFMPDKVLPLLNDVEMVHNINGNELLFTSYGLGKYPEAPIASLSVEAFNTNKTIDSLGTIVAYINGKKVRAVCTNNVGAILNNNSFSQVPFDFYPVPACDFLNIKINHVSEYSKLSLISLEGKVLKTWRLSQNEAQIDIQAFRKGIYLLNYTDNTTSTIKRFIKE